MDFKVPSQCIRMSSLVVAALSILSSQSFATIIRPMRQIPQTSSLKQDVFFTINSDRRDPTAEEAKPILMIGGVCTGFFVANEENKFFVATARHCANFEMTASCPTLEVATSSGEVVGKCSRVVAGTRQDDLVIIEAAFNKPAEEILSKISFLSLASFVPQPYEQLKTIGFPADDERKMSMTLTENCWDTSGVGYTPDGISTAVIGGNTGYSPSDRQQQAYFNELQRKLRWYNCSTWGGNSGGPVILAGTEIAVGLPGGYDPKVNFTGKFYPYNISRFYETTSGFVAHNRAALVAAKVTIAETNPLNPADSIARTKKWIKDSGQRPYYPNR